MVNTTSIPTSKEWLDAFLKSTDEFAQSSLNLNSSKIPSEGNPLPWHDTIGAYVPWINDHYAIQLGLLSTRQGCAKLAKKLLCMEPEEEISAEDMTDALQEIMNILAGMTKGLVGGSVSAQNMGLPVFIDGFINMSHTQEVLVELIKIGDIPCYLILLHLK